MAEQPQYSSLRDYLALLRRQKLVVAAVTLAFGGAALALSASQEESYEAKAATRFNDIARSAALLGALDLPPDINIITNAAVKTEEVRTLATARKVQRELRTDISADRLQSAVTAGVGAQTIFVEITAAWDDPGFAAKLANTYADVVVDDENRRLEKLLDESIKDLKPRAEGPILEDDGATINVPRFNARNSLSALSSLKSLVDSGAIVPAEIARRAEVPTDPSSPQTARNTVLGVIIGLALGLIAAFIRDTLDRRIRTAKDAHDAYGLPVLARVGQAALGTTGGAGGNGAANFMTAADVESFRILRTNMAALNPDTPPRSVLVTSGLPEAGKSTVAAALAAASAAAGQRTLLVDADLRRPVLATRLGIPASPGLSEYLAGTADAHAILHTVPVRPAGTTNGNQGAGRSLVCIPAGDAAGEPAELLASERLGDFVTKVSQVYDLVVIDTSPLLVAADPLELLPHVDSVALCVRLTRSTTDEARAVQDAVRLLPERPAGLVVTGVGASDNYYGYYGD